MLRLFEEGAVRCPGCSRARTRRSARIGASEVSEASKTVADLLPPHVDGLGPGTKLAGGAGARSLSPTRDLWNNSIRLSYGESIDRSSPEPSDNRLTRILSGRRIPYLIFWNESLSSE